MCTQNNNENKTCLTHLNQDILAFMVKYLLLAPPNKSYNISLICYPQMKTFFCIFARLNRDRTKWQLPYTANYVQHQEHFIMSTFPLCFMGVTNSYYYYDDDDIKSFSRVGILDLQFGSTADMLVCKSQYTNCLLSKHLSFLVLEH